MKKINIILIGFAFLIFTLLLVDQKMFRCFYLSKITAYPHLGQIENEKTNIKYQIIKLESGDYKYSIQNNSLIPKYLIGYRDDKLIPEFNSKQLFDLGSRKILRAPNKKVKDKDGFDCGTGLRTLSINSFEKISMEETYQELLNKFYLTDLLEERDSKYYDIVRGELMFIRDEKNELVLVEEMNITEKDSVEIQFYLPSYSIFNGNQSDNYSNSIKISYLDLLSGTC